jgi:hypothetical protein
MTTAARSSSIAASTWTADSRWPAQPSPPNFSNRRGTGACGRCAPRSRNSRCGPLSAASRQTKVTLRQAIASNHRPHRATPHNLQRPPSPLSRTPHEAFPIAARQPTTPGFLNQGFELRLEDSRSQILICFKDLSYGSKTREVKSSFVQGFELRLEDSRSQILICSRI